MTLSRRAVAEAVGTAILLARLLVPACSQRDFLFNLIQ